MGPADQPLPAALAASFLHASPRPSTDAKAVDAEALGRALVAAWEEGRSAWPRVALESSRFAEHLGTHVVIGEAADLLETPHLADLYLACACVHGAPAALEELERRFFPEVRDALRRLQLPEAQREDVQQSLRHKLFVGEAGAPPKLASYAGRGPLAGWLCAAAIRTALSTLRRAPKESALADEQILELTTDDPELEHIRRRFRAEFREAFRLALQALEAQQRNLLRLSFLDGLSIDEIGALFGAHRSTAARWIVRARRTLYEETRRVLAERFRFTSSEVDSLMRLMRGQLDLSLSRYFKSSGDSR